MLTTAAKFRVIFDKHPLSTEWWKKLDAIAGLTVEVETKHLFDDQYNTAPIPGISSIGMRIMDVWVEEVIDDERIGRQKCSWCGTHSVITGGDDVCPKCEKTEYLQPFKIYNRKK